ncbi:YxeA family protein [Companilactobacillus zhongbaensis]|uniref:YxeA family protein n=1 Tax=Companilactobacillus zhongbaensis TaxID=2486009 RepID=UPI000F7B29CF|nr:YxeA family protein [Companilactobacillus zhongbaensis]
MKSLLKFLFIAALIIGGSYVGACVYTKDKTDQFSQALGQYNFLVKREPLYVKIDNTNAKDEDGYGNYEYNLTSYDKEGNAHKSSFTGMGKLKQDHYLELDTKGAYVYTYKETFPNKMPEKVAEKLVK